MASRWKVNITPAERIARIVIGGLGVLAGVVLLGIGPGGRWRWSSSCSSCSPASTSSSPARSDTARSTPGSATCRPH